MSDSGVNQNVNQRESAYLNHLESMDWRGDFDSPYIPLNRSPETTPNGVAQGRRDIFDSLALSPCVLRKARARQPRS